MCILQDWGKDAQINRWLEGDPSVGVKRLNLFLFFFSVRELRQQLTTPLIVLLTILRTFVFNLTDTHAQIPSNDSTFRRRLFYLLFSPFLWSYHWYLSEQEERDGETLWQMPPPTPSTHVCWPQASVTLCRGLLSGQGVMPSRFQVESEKPESW